MISLFHQPEMSLKSESDRLKAAYERLVSRSDLGFINLLKEKSPLDPSIDRAKKLKPNVKTLCVVGIGGSHLGIEVIYQAFKLTSDIEIIFFDNVDPVVFERKINNLLDLSTTHWLVISKSGKTIETLTLTNFIEQGLRLKGQSLSPLSATVITELKPSPLYDWAYSKGIPILALPVDLGGRFSVLSAVGMFPVSLMGFDAERFLVGARGALDEKNLVTQLATIFIHSFSDKKWITMFWSYSDRLERFGFWLQQLWSESLAKGVTCAGGAPGRVSTPVACRGANDQHSVLQQVIEGASDKLLVFTKIAEDRKYGGALQTSMFSGLNLMNDKTMGELLFAECDATIKSVEESGVPCVGIELEDLSEESLGTLFMTFQLVIGVLGEYLGIDAYNQPGVERSKVLTSEFLSN